MAENNNTVNEIKENQETQEAPVQEQSKEAEKPAKVKEKVTWKLGPVSIDLNPKVAKFLKISGGVLLGGAAVATGVAVGSTITERKKNAVIRGKDADIAKLTDQLAAATAPVALPEIPELPNVAAEVIPEVVDSIIDG